MASNKNCSYSNRNEKIQKYRDGGILPNIEACLEGYGKFRELYSLVFAKQYKPFTTRNICLLRNMKEKSLAVVACDGKDNMSIRVPEGFLELHKSFKIHSKQFVYETLTGWGLDSEKTYSFKGEYLEEQKMLVFCLKNADL